MRAFYCDALGLKEIPKPSTLQARGGFWVQVGNLQMHLGVDPDFVPAKKAHPAFRVPDLSALAAALEKLGHHIDWDETRAEMIRFFTSDPVGNRLEFIQD